MKSPSAVTAQASAATGGWSVSLSYTADTTIALTATVNQPLDSAGKYVEIFDLARRSSITYVKYCSTGTTCSVNTVPGEAQGRYVAVVGSSLTNTYAGYPADQIFAQSDVVTPPAWSVHLTETVDSKVHLTATTNYTLDNRAGQLEIFDVNIHSWIGYVNFCSKGTTCTGVTVPKEAHTSYIAVIGLGGVNLYDQYPAERAWGQSNMVSPPAWRVSLKGSGSTLTATSNYTTDNGPAAVIYDITKPQTWITYVKFCFAGVSCTGTTSSPGHLFVAVITPSPSNTFPPDPIFAISTIVGAAGPTDSRETSGGSNPSELNCHACAGDPIDTQTGQFFQDATDVSFPEPGPALAVQRTYSTDYLGTDGPFGDGWNGSYRMQVQPQDDGSVAVVQENGSVVTFQPDGSGGYTAPGRVLATLTTTQAAG